MQKNKILGLAIIALCTTITGCKEEPIPDFKCSYSQPGTGVTDTTLFKDRSISNDGKYFIYKSDDSGYTFKIEVDRRTLEVTNIMSENKTNKVISYLTGECK